MYTKTPKSIGRGNFSEVYQAVSSDGGQYAWKQLKSDADNSDKERFRREVEILSKLQHANIVDIVYTDLVAQHPYYIMPRAKHNLESANLHDVNRRLDIKRIFREICDALIYAHSQGVLHRDLKPKNILLTDEGSVKVADFGMARSSRLHASGLTGVDEKGGTTPYAAPEQSDKSLKDVDERAEVHSLGSILYFLFTKREPYHIDGLDPNLPEEIYNIVKRATDRDLRVRFQGVEELLNEFNKVTFWRSKSTKPVSTARPRKYAAVQFELQELAKSSKVGKFSTLKNIERIATELQMVLWKNRMLLWEGRTLENPLAILDPAVAFDLLAFQMTRPPTLGTSFDNGEEYEVAGEINQRTKSVSISRQFDNQIIRFTEAHELGHSFLHKQELLHRDRPVNGSYSTQNIRPEEFQANKFATYFLMPEKQVRMKFTSIFGTGKFQIDRTTSEALIQDDVDALISMAKNRRGLARLIASATQIGTRRVYSLAEQFGVSNGAMAIRLEELGMVDFPRSDPYLRP
jgi:Zn-dependent peptidase ImmA (M78 family)